jgi:hypothetical protein
MNTPREVPETGEKRGLTRDALPGVWRHAIRVDVNHCSRSERPRIESRVQEETPMATQKQRTAAKRNVRKAIAGAKAKKSIASMPKKTRTALGKQGAAVAKRKRTGGTSPKTRQELYEEAKRRNLAGRSKMGRDELARALRER